jgi:hypothetical protein
VEASDPSRSDSDTVFDEIRFDVGKGEVAATAKNRKDSSQETKVGKFAVRGDRLVVTSEGDESEVWFRFEKEYLVIRATDGSGAYWLSKR